VPLSRRWFGWCLGAAACTDDGVVAFELDFDGAFWATPLPGEHRRVGGVVALDGLPNDDGVRIVDALVAALDGARGFGTTSAVVLPLRAPLDPEAVPDLFASVDPEAAVRLVALDGPRAGTVAPVEWTVLDDGGPFGPDAALVALPLQGVPLAPDTTYALVATDALTSNGAELAPPADLDDLLRGRAPVGLADPTPWFDALDALDGLGVRRKEIVGLTVFRTDDPTRGLAEALPVARASAPAWVGAPTPVDVYDTFCVFEGAVELPVLQRGTPPWDDGEGAWADPPTVEDRVAARVFVTLPRATAPAGGWPTVVFVRTGAGGDRPLVDRGIRAEPGGADVPGTGPATWITAAGYAGVSVDGPLVGERNPTGGDEQFLVFDLAHPDALRDNLRQSALELAILPDVLGDVALDPSGCEGASLAGPALSTDTLALFGHSMGATIAPLVTWANPAYDAVLLSGAGGSWVENVVYKQSPLEVRPLAEAMLGYAGDRELTTSDPALLFLQWAGEAADPPVYAAHTDGVHVLMAQGIVDTYILPPMANATSLSFGLDLGGDPLDADHPELTSFRGALDVLPLVGRGAVALPASGNHGGATRIVVQHPEDGVEDGHEVVYQTAAPKSQMEAFLVSLRDGTPEVPAVDAP
jgi:hypothetical protein